ncbi:MAG: RNA-directed DNA polymerase, partial [bacterium]|nr:RNA-directed DNA polymerase [bacterium]
REREIETGNALQKGIPIGNLTSQLFANVYMNEFDRHMKNNLKVKHYFRYTDDFVIVSSNEEYLHDILPRVNTFLQEKLKLKLHPNKVSIRKLHQGVDFLGYVVFPKHRLVRSKTRRRIFKKMRGKIGEYRLGKIAGKSLEQSLQSYLGVLSHANTHKLRERLKNEIWF